MAAGTIFQCVLENAVQRRQRLPARLQVVVHSAATEGKIGIGRGGNVWQGAQKSHLRPDLVISALRRPGGHPGIFEPVLYYPEQFLVAPVPDAVLQPRRGRNHVGHDRRLAYAGGTMTGGAACRVITGRPLDQGRIGQVQPLGLFDRR